MARIINRFQSLKKKKKAYSVSHTFPEHRYSEKEKKSAPIRGPLLKPESSISKSGLSFVNTCENIIELGYCCAKSADRNQRRKTITADHAVPILFPTLKSALHNADNHLAHPGLPNLQKYPTKQNEQR